MSEIQIKADDIIDSLGRQLAQKSTDLAIAQATISALEKHVEGLNALLAQSPTVESISAETKEGGGETND